MTEPPGVPLWGGRFSSRPHPEMERLTRSINVDLRLLPDDLEATQAHARALAAAGLVDAAQVEAVDAACRAILTDFGTGALRVDATDEDVHTLVERELTDRLGEIGARIHAGRSRNDLVAADLRSWCKASATGLLEAVADLVEALIDVAETHARTVMPGYTHLQRAQPVSLGFHLAAHAFALTRDGRRFSSARGAADVSVLGAGAVAGTTLPLDAGIAASHLGFATTFHNAMDAVSDRDFVCDLLYACALCGVHLSRLAEEIVLWTSSEFSFARLPDDWSTGSSMMPQKRNPDLAELIRGRSAAAIGELTAGLSLLKGLPLAYDRDLQEDKALVFSGVDRTRDCISGATYLVGALEFDERVLQEAAEEGAAWATDVAESLVRKGVPFREAHEAVGRLVAHTERREVPVPSLPDDELAACHPRLERQDLAGLDPVAGMARRRSHGGAAPERVMEQLALLRSEVAALRHGVP